MRSIWSIWQADGLAVWFVLGPLCSSSYAWAPFVCSEEARPQPPRFLFLSVSAAAFSKLAAKDSRLRCDVGYCIVASRGAGQGQSSEGVPSGYLRTVLQALHFGPSAERV